MLPTIALIRLTARVTGPGVALTANGHDELWIDAQGRVQVRYDVSDWELRCLLQDGAGDGTVPLSSGCAPEQQSPSSIKLQRGLKGFGHEPAYQDAAMQRHTLFCINKIAGLAKLPT